MYRSDISWRYMADLSPTARVILGMIAVGRRTGYEIKQLVDQSTRYFWAASYGQIYPELRRLEQEGLVRSQPEPSGGRARTTYDLTDDGEEALRGWLCSDAEAGYELRDEGMLKLFFSDVAPETTIETVRALRALNERKLEGLTSLQAKVPQMRQGARLTLEMGIALTRCTIEWCEATEQRLEPAQVEA
jgi:DNA-binding PadR family transcriptional regulator